MRASRKPPPRTKPPEERRGELMASAQRLFLKHGVAATTVDQITTGAKVAKGTFYLYFSSKEEVLAALEEQFAAEHLAKIRAAVDGVAPHDWNGKLGAWAAAGAVSYLDAIQLHDVLFFGSRPVTREGLVDSIVIDHLESLLSGGNRAGAWHVEDCRFAAVFLFSGLHAAVDDAYCKKRVHRSRLAERLQESFFRLAGVS